MAWISRDRRTVFAGFLNPDGTPISGTFALATDLKDNGWVAYQTAVEWSSAEERWMVTWGEADEAPGTWKKNGRIRLAYVTWNGSFIKPKHVMYCEGDTAVCGPSKSSAVGAPTGQLPGLPKENHQCVCKGYWFASSYYGHAVDRYRLIHYGKMARIDMDGGPTVAPFLGGTYQPVTEAAYLYGETLTPFQSLRTTVHYHLPEASSLYYYAGPVNTTTINPQAFRSNGSVAVALTSSGSTLKVGVVDLYSGGCP